MRDRLPCGGTPYEDVARILHVAQGEALDVGGLAERHMDTTTVGNLAHDLADLFTANNPAYCTHCDQPENTTEEVCHTPDEKHNFEGGFDRERFLITCGLEKEG